MPDWEYYVHYGLRFTSNEPLKTETNEILNKIGGNGWELVSIFPSLDHDVNVYLGIFKREKKKK